MRTVEEVLVELRQLAAKAGRGENVSESRQRVEQELKTDHGIHVQATPAATLAQAPRQASPEEIVQRTLSLVLGRGGSRFAGQGADLAAVQALAADGPNLGHRVAPTGRGGPTLSGTMSKALAESTGSAGGVLVPVEVAKEIVTIVRNRTAVLQFPVTIVPVQKELDIPSFSSGTAPQFVAENARLPVSEQTFAVTPKLTPYELGTLLPISNRLLRDAQTIPALEDALRSDMADGLAARLDLAFLDGPGTGQPIGLRQQPSTTPVMGGGLGVNGGVPTFDDFKKMVASLRATNAPFRNPGWIFSPRTLNTLETLKDSTGRYLMETGLLEIDAAGNSGRLLGYRFVATGNVFDGLTTGTSTDTSYVVFSSDWQECWIGENDSLSIDASSEATYSTDGGTTHQSAYQQRQTVFRATAAYDICLRRPEWTTVMKGVRA